MPNEYAFDEVARLPLPGDNVAIATHQLEAGDTILTESGSFALSAAVLLGHRFAIRPIARGEFLTSWELPFGEALVDIDPGTYVCNTGILDALRLRDLPFELPIHPNFGDRIVPHDLDAGRFTAGTQIGASGETRTFKGYARPGGRGVGTRNTIVLLGTSSRTGSFVKQLERRSQELVETCDNLDGIVAVAHTEAGEATSPNNRDYVLRTLAGFVVHPNVAAVLAVDYGTESITNADLRSFLETGDYPLHSVPHAFFSIEDGFTRSLDAAESIVKTWLEPADACTRSDQPISELKIALQCGGSDAFSGVSGNPLASWVAREVVRDGGCANLAETDELIGAEAYILKNCRDEDTARRFLEKIEGYKTLAAWHGTTAEGNPSGGNKYRGLYNIVLKSIGAAMKRHPEVRLDDVIDYGQPMPGPGYYFMDSPGNDLESIAGQVASGCNMIFFVTGNGSITNFPFVPTLKLITTTSRYTLLENEMDVNAGAYLDGTSMDDLGADMLDLTLETASGRLSKGETAGHSQVSLWRNWRQTDTTGLPALLSAADPEGPPVAVHPADTPVTAEYSAIQVGEVSATDRVGLILPTSLCSGQIARICAEQLNDLEIGKDRGISKFVPLVHTEGCGVAGEEAERAYTRTMLGYLTHPLVQVAYLLEHGCEKTHNDYLRHALAERGLDASRYGWASIQMDGGIDRVLAMARAWVSDRLSQDPPATVRTASMGELRIGISSVGRCDDATSEAMGRLVRRLVGSGAVVVVPENASFLDSVRFVEDVFCAGRPEPTLANGSTATEPGLHIMSCHTGHWVETLTGMGGTGVEMILAAVRDNPVQGHPMVPVYQVGPGDSIGPYIEDLDLVLSGRPADDADALITLLARAASREILPRSAEVGNLDFQFTRGLLGVSM